MQFNFMSQPDSAGSGHKTSVSSLRGSSDESKLSNQQNDFDTIVVDLTYKVGFDSAFASQTHSNQLTVPRSVFNVKNFGVEI